jgi:RHS repeat-associated protein
VQDRLGSVAYESGGNNLRYYPWGEEYTTTAQNQEKFGTYYRDQTTALDYARNRYYSSTLGRFLTADPYRAMASGANNPADPGSWNRYAYALNDPVKFNDPSGLGACDSSEGDPGMIMVNGTCVSGALFSLMLDNFTGAGGVGSSTNVSPNPGITNAQDALINIKAGAFEKKQKCKDFFQALISENGLNISVDALMNEVVDEAGLASGNVFDGPQSQTVLDSAKFPGAASTGVNTVSQWFAAHPGSEALSQINGAAIWINSDNWSGLLSPYVNLGTPNSYGLGTMLHELLHKQDVGGGFTHYPGDPQLENALKSIGALSPYVGRNAISNSLANICF